MQSITTNLSLGLSGCFILVLSTLKYLIFRIIKILKKCSYVRCPMLLVAGWSWFTLRMGNVACGWDHLITSPSPCLLEDIEHCCIILLFQYLYQRAVIKKYVLPVQEYIYKTSNIGNMSSKRGPVHVFTALKLLVSLANSTVITVLRIKTDSRTL